MNTSRSCPLCHSAAIRAFASIGVRHYFECGCCRLIHLAQERRPDRLTEERHYRLHENDPADQGYRKFLSRLLVPLTRRLSPGMQGLDYGSGPGPTLSIMLEEQGYPMRIYDPLFAPDAGALQRSYDFITCSEAVEHFHTPSRELQRLDGLLLPGGWLAIMTGIFLDESPFADWHYVRDPTHVCFYRPATMKWIAAARRWALELAAPNVALFHKRRS